MGLILLPVGIENHRHELINYLNSGHGRGIFQYWENFTSAAVDKRAQVWSCLSDGAPKSKSSTRKGSIGQPSYLPDVCFICLGDSAVVVGHI